MNNSDLAWMAGIAVGEGCFLNVRRGRKKDLTYIAFSLQMCDIRSIERFSALMKKHLGKRPAIYRIVSCSGSLIARISFVGELAARLGYLLLPYMDGTDKGDQFLRVLRIAGGDVKENKLIYEKRHPRTHGENNPNVKLTKTQVNAIRRAASNHSRLTHKEKYGMNLVTNLAKRFDVTNATIQNVIRGSTW